jgi:hypothetical protein
MTYRKLAAVLFAVSLGSFALADATTQPSAAKPYPLKTCIVSDETLGEMGEPIVQNYNGQEVKFCCESCPKKFAKNPDKYLKKLAAAPTTKPAM